MTVEPDGGAILTPDQVALFQEIKARRLAEDGIAPEAFYGLAGEIVSGVEPYTEADRVAVLINTLIRFGAAVGSGPHFYVGDTRHAANEDAVLVGPTATGRKGSSDSSPRRLYDEADPDFFKRVRNGGLSSGEGLINQVRDSRTEKQSIKEKGRVIDYQDVIVDAGVEDKRLLVIEQEFSSALTVMAREGNILSPILRQAWDGGTLAPMTKNNAITATGAHIGIIGHITRDELLRKLGETEQANGFANRFIWLAVTRSKLLPHGARPPDAVMNGLSNKLKRALDRARLIGEIQRDDEARAMWETAYGELEKGIPGLVGAILARGSAHVLRLSMIFALMDGEAIIRPPHLLAALALWDWSVKSVKRIFGDKTGDSIADRILSELTRRTMSKTEISYLLGRHVPAWRLNEALVRLAADGKIEETEELDTGGRPRNVYALTGGGEGA